MYKVLATHAPKDNNGTSSRLMASRHCTLTLNGCAIIYPGLFDDPFNKRLSIVMSKHNCPEIYPFFLQNQIPNNVCTQFEYQSSTSICIF